MVKAGKLKPLAVVNHARLPEYPDLPTMQEVGFPGVGTIAWNGMFAPAATPKTVLETISRRPCGAQFAGRQGGVRQAAFQHRAEQIARRRQDLARRRDQNLAGDHQRGEDRRRSELGG